MVKAWMRGFIGYLALIALMFILTISPSQAFLSSQLGELAVYYGPQLPSIFRLYRQVVVQPTYIWQFDPKQFDTSYRQSFAYVSVGEWDQRESIPNKQWLLGMNKVWKSPIIDQSNIQWQKFIIDNIITKWWNQGYRGFYLDTLDSYYLITKDPAKIKQQQDGLIAIIKAIKKKYPDAQLILNRGIEIAPAVHTLVSRMTIESVFAGWNQGKKQYYSVPPEERQWVLRDIDKVKKLGIPVTIIDYVSPENQKTIESTRQQIQQIGCDAWITDKTLSLVNLPSSALTLPRKILVFYRGKVGDVDERVGSYANKSLTMPLNYAGYRVELRNINDPLPKEVSPEEYAGVVVSIDGVLLGREHELYAFYQALLHHKIPVLILNDFGLLLNNEVLKPFGLTIPIITHKSHEFKTINRSPMIGYELEPIPQLGAFAAIRLSKKEGMSLFRVQDGIGTIIDIAAIMPWGGFYIGSSFLQSFIMQEYHWSINPFAFFKQALQFPESPIPDITSENGRRLMFTHVDGDGFANKGEWYGSNYVGDIMRREIFERYALPTTVSVIQGEIAKNGIHPDLSDELEAIAKKIFALPTIELASHTYSHPYNWQKAAAWHGSGFNPNILAIPHYRFNLKKEIVGSVKYINQHLAPANKQCKIFLWSGEGDVPEKALKMVHDLGLRNLNPGTLITKYNTSMTRVSALGVNEGPYFQVFAPIGNDQEVEGSSGQRFFYSIVNLIEALKLTEEPVRLKPIDIYLHFYTMAQHGGVKALQAVYEWVLKQPIMAIYSSEYVDKVTDFNNLTILKQGNAWLLATHDDLREFRIADHMGYPDLIHSHNIAGFNHYQGQYYVHVAPGGDAKLVLTTSPPKLPYLVTANARLTDFKRNSNHLHLSFKGYQPIQFVLANTQNCQVAWNHVPLQTQSSSPVVVKETQGEVDIQCP